MKKIFSIAIFIFSLSFFSTQNALAEMNDDKEQVSDFFINFIDAAFNNVDGINVRDSNNLDVTDYFIDNTSEYYSSGDYKYIQDFIFNENLFLSYEEIKPLIEEKNVNTFSNLRTESKTEYFYNIGTEKTGRFSKEWGTKLSGTLTFNNSTNQIVSATQPVLTLTDAAWGLAFSAGLNNVTTNRSIIGNSVKFSASYKMGGYLLLDFGGLPLGFNLDFGNYTDSFTAYPSSLQN